MIGGRGAMCMGGSGKIKATVIGAAGYAGIEVVRTLLGHPDIALVMATSNADAGQRLADAYPSLEGATELEFSEHDADKVAHSCDIAFLAVPHTAALGVAPQLLDAGVTVFDLSADYRLSDPKVYEEWYGVEHTSPDILAQAVYGQPELNHGALQALAARRQAGHAVLVGCAGCYPTATILASAPAFAHHLAAEGPVIVNALSGVSGAGKGLRATSHFCSADENVNAYGATTHRHTPEMEQALTQVAGREVHVVFTPHLVPMKRGLLSTVAIPLKPSATVDDVSSAYRSAYESSPFVSVLGSKMPQTASVVGTNNAQVGFVVDRRSNTLVSSCAIDNLDKGAAMQAVQCANIVLGFDETAGLGSVGPII